MRDFLNIELHHFLMIIIGETYSASLVFNSQIDNPVPLNRHICLELHKLRNYTSIVTNLAEIISLGINRLITEGFLS